ncbi:MAG: hypothetical protein IH840_17220 [Candidatus Heimdallarchaeota archaeon]|nr:hypothetical protein [Candidatus Heimdallarchaeota archaeon]
MTYLEVVCELKWNPTEKKETLEGILDNFLDATTIEDQRFEGIYLVRRGSDLDSLQLIADWIRDMKQLDTIRKRLLKSINGNITALYFNRQAAAMNRISLVDVDDNPPLGAVAFQIVSDDLESIIDQLAPRTFKGKELSRQELEQMRAKKKEAMLKSKKRKSISKFRV